MPDDLTHLNRFIASAPDAMLVVGESGDILLANDQAHELFLAPPGGLVGLCVDKLVPESLRTNHVEHRAEFSAHPETRPMGGGSELLAARRDGSEFPTEISLSPLPGDGRRLVLAAVRDLTARKAADQKLLDTRLELERREARERQALEINDGIVQALAVAEYRLAQGDHDKAREAVRESLEAARDIITDLLGEDPTVAIQPGDLRRQTPGHLGGRSS